MDFLSILLLLLHNRKSQPNRHRSKKYPVRRRKFIVITARVHAGEVTGSFKVEGIIKYLTGKSNEVCHLREIFVFKIIPMLNPDGVICGNSRCSLTGSDLNRRWDEPNEILHPQIYFLKNLMDQIKSENKEILVFCDLHGHSRKNGSFIYGCNKAANGGFCSWTKVRLLPRILAKKTPLFTYNECRFGVTSNKQRTARVVVWKEFGVTNSFTFESSFYGYMIGNVVIPFSISNYYSLGESLLSSLLEYHYLVKGLEKEFVITRGWLKPSRLIELTGTPAVEVVIKRMERQKKELKRKQHTLKRQTTIPSNKELCKLAISESFEEQKQIRKKQHKVNTNKKPISLGISSTPKNIITRYNPENEYIADSETIEINEPQAKLHNWRDYFSSEELQSICQRIEEGIEPDDNESESDSNPSEGYIEKEELEELVLNKPLKVSKVSIDLNPQAINSSQQFLNHPTPLIQLKNRMQSNNNPITLGLSYSGIGKSLENQQMKILSSRKMRQLTVHKRLGHINLPGTNPSLNNSFNNSIRFIDDNIKKKSAMLNKLDSTKRNNRPSFRKVLDKTYIQNTNVNIRNITMKNIHTNSLSFEKQKIISDLFTNAKNKHRLDNISIALPKLFEDKDGIKETLNKYNYRKKKREPILSKLLVDSFTPMTLKDSLIERRIDKPIQITGLDFNTKFSKTCKL